MTKWRSPRASANRKPATGGTDANGQEEFGSGASDLELLPKDSGEAQAVPRIIAQLMDNLFHVPGTKLRFGLNPVLDLIPVVGDGAAAVVSTLTLLVAARSGVPKIVITRMGMNILLNAVIGIFPIVGEGFALWFRPSSRNYEILKKHLPRPGTTIAVSTNSDRLFVLGITALVLLIFTLCTVTGLLLSMLIARTLFVHR